MLQKSFCTAIRLPRFKPIAMGCNPDLCQGRLVRVAPCSQLRLRRSAMRLEKLAQDYIRYKQALGARFETDAMLHILFLCGFPLVIRDQFALQQWADRNK